MADDGGTDTATAQDWAPYPAERFGEGKAPVSVRIETRGQLARVWLVGPGKGNAFGPDFWSELPGVFGVLEADDEVRAIVVAGQGGTFSYGLDLMAVAGSWGDKLGLDGGLARARTFLHDEVLRMQAAMDAVANCRKPVAAAIAGWCIGAGVDLIACCDVRYAAADARFSVREVRVAMVADMGSLQRLPAIIGDGHFRELALTGKDVDAAHALRIGLVNEVYDDADGALAAAEAFAEEMSANPPLVVQGIKRVLEAARRPAVDAGLHYVAAWNAAFMPSQDLGEAMAAFAQRRPPEFSGR